MRKKRDRTFQIEWVPGIENIREPEWDALAVPLETPLLEWQWLRQFEVSGSMVPELGWLPYHLTIRAGSDLVAAAPLYIKGHSQGEFVWDYMWADVASQLNVKYYPKLIGMSPATPSIGYRFLISPAEDEEYLTEIMLYAIDNFCSKNNLSGSSFHFVDPDWKAFVVKHGYSAWLHQSFEWKNQLYGSFDDYLESFTKNQRRNIKRERERVRNQGVSIRAFTGDEIPEKFLPSMYRFYEKTNDQFGPWGAKFLNRAFFEGLHAEFRHRLLIMAAFEDRNPERPIAMSFLLAKGTHIIGRYWGASKDIDSLHFDACYYSPIEWAIKNGVESFDPGAGSPHKLRRGFFAVGNHSLHRYQDPHLRNVMEMHIDEINRMEQERIDSMNATVPFKREKLPLNPSHIRRPH